MKFVELKNSLDREVKPVYIIQGDDRFVCYNALQIFEKRFAVNYPSMNRMVFDSDAKMQTIVDSALVFPLGDEYKLIEVRDFKPQNEKQDAKILETYLNSPLESSILVFFNSFDNDFFKSFNKKVEVVDCNRLEDKWLYAWIKQNSKSENVSIDDDAISELIMLSDNSLSKISTEFKKLASFVGSNGEINKTIVNKFVEKSKDYKVYELTSEIANKNGKNALIILNSILEMDNNSVGLLGSIYKHFERLFMISTSTSTDAELASLFNIKPYAVQMLRKQLANFSTKNLKKIISMLGELDYKIKSGKINADGSVVYAICNILQIG